MLGPSEHSWATTGDTSLWHVVTENHRKGFPGQERALQDWIQNTHSNTKRNTTCSDTDKTCWDPLNTLGQQQGTLPWHVVPENHTKGGCEKGKLLYKTSYCQ